LGRRIFGMDLGMKLELGPELLRRLELELELKPELF
jgi:hypothetical protein